mmetsp:Transcript_5518/g.7799  ORF Transcript_5518/g.7799 Transcript_5518/m.7799 type:complete len:109 (+) Transcript_5518:95-421(+)
MLANTIARAARMPLARQAMTATTRVAMRPVMSPIGARFASHYDLNKGFPGSRIKNPDPENYNDVYPDMGYAWWGLILGAVYTFVYGSYYDTSRPVAVSIGLFGPNMPL